MKYHQDHYDVFRKNLTIQTGAIGSDVKAWWGSVIGKQECDLPNKVTREQLKDICRNPLYSDKACVAAIMAWGGQNRKHGRILFSRFEEIQPIISDIRNQSIDYVGAYQKFDKIWKQKKPLGMGAAYFTKLIFFCDPRHQGFIMDQWTSKSVNLICAANIVHLVQGYVSKNNDYQTYIEFCQIVRDIAKELGKTPENIEMSMFSSGGHTKGRWRDYVSKTYS